MTHNDDEFTECYSGIPGGTFGWKPVETKVNGGAGKEAKILARLLDYR